MLAMLMVEEDDIMIEDNARGLFFKDYHVHSARGLELEWNHIFGGRHEIMIADQPSR